MGSTEECSYDSMASNKATSRSEKGRRVWTQREEEALLLGMKEIVAQGWKSDNGFRAGYLNKLEEIFRKKMPGTDLRGSPHMNSKLSIWKKDYNTLCTILNQSGVGFNTNGTYTVDCDETLWDSIIKIDPNAKKIHKKSWPMYDDWKEIFGKDRANGVGAEEYFEAINNLEQGYGSNPDGFPGDYHVDLDDILSGEGEGGGEGEGVANNTFNANHPPPNASQSSSKGKGQKRKALDGIDKVCALIEGISHNANSRMDKVASRFGHDQVLGQARMDIFNKLPNIPGFMLSDKLSVCEILIENDKKLELFIGLPEDAKVEYCIRLLGCN